MTFPDPLAGLTEDVRAVFERARQAAAATTLPLFRTVLTVDNKQRGGFDPVTRADTEAEQAIRAVILDSFPDHSIVGEELADTKGSAPFTWIIDPIDGTWAYISGVPVWGTLVGLLYQGRAVAGMMAQPFSDECWIAIGDECLYSRGPEQKPARTSTVTTLATAKLTATAPDMFVSPDQRAVWRALTGATLKTRFGLDCYGYCLLASGQIDLVVESQLKNVDIAPLIPIIRGAGGVVTTWDGGPAEAGGDCVAAANADLHAAALDAIAMARSGRE